MGRIEKADISRLERRLLFALAYGAGAFFLNHQKPGRLRLNADQFARAVDPLRVSFDVNQVEAWHMRERD
jgi:hypothetical protein